MTVPLIPCRACGASVSVHAKACPQCGQPVVATTAGKPVALALVAIGALVSVLYIVQSLGFFR